MFNKLRKFLRYSCRPYARSRRLAMRLHGVIGMDNIEGLVDSAVRGIVRGMKRDVAQ